MIVIIGLYYLLYFLCFYCIDLNRETYLDKNYSREDPVNELVYSTITGEQRNYTET